MFVCSSLLLIKHLARQMLPGFETMDDGYIQGGINALQHQKEKLVVYTTYIYLCEKEI